MRMGSGTRGLLCLIVGWGAGALAAAWHPPAAAAILKVADPIATLWVNAIRMTVIPLVVSLLIVGVASAGNLRSVGRLAWRAMLVFTLLLIAAALLTALIAPPVFAHLHVDPLAAAALRARTVESAASAPVLPTLTDWITSLIPQNPVKAAVDGAMLPLLVFTIAFALGISRLPEETRATLLQFFRGTGDAMLVLVRWVLAMSPIGITALSLALGARIGLGAAGVIAAYLATQCGMELVLLALLYPTAVLGGRVSFANFARAALPAQAVAMSTRSSLAALPAMLAASERRLGLPRSVAAFVLPFGVSVFRLSTASAWIVHGLFVAKLYDVPFGASSMATLAVASIITSFSVPGIPSGGLLISAPFFHMVGLPVEGIAVLIALDALPDAFKTLTNATGHLAAATVVAAGADLANLDAAA